jgi:endonuclease/exonuclease/phosphatase family metal-dependent hydrolase
MDTRQIWFRPKILRELALPALLIAIGLQISRIFFPSLAWYLKDTVGVGSITLAGYAFGAFSFAFLASVLRRLAGPRLSLLITGGGLALLRLAEQIVIVPQIDLWLSMAGIILFLLFLPIFVGHVRVQGGPMAAPRLGYGLLLGVALDTAIHGAASTLDLSWIPGVVPLLVVVLLCALALWLLVVETLPGNSQASEASWKDALPLIALGPYFTIQALVLQNQGWVSEIGGIQPGLAFVVVMVGNLLAIGAMAWAFARPNILHPLLGLATAFYIGWAGYSAATPHPGFLLTTLVSQLLMGWSWGVLVTVTIAPKKRGLWRTTLSLGIGMFLFLILSFIYYVSLDIALPIPRSAILPSAAILLGLIVFLASLRVRNLAGSPWRDWTPIVIATALVLVPLGHWLAQGSVDQPEAPSALPTTVMTYNLHSAYDVSGRQDPEAIAQVIEASGAKIIALQEISRGWLINGSTDLATWLAQRLRMQVLFQGTTGPMWGNAILTSYPILEYGSGTLPSGGALLGRGYLWALVDIGLDQPLQVIATHLHHLEAENEIRLLQVPELLEYWDGAPLSLIMGDLNAEPHYPEIDLFVQAGLLDSWMEAGEGDGLTWPADDPFERIDWVWHTPDLLATRAVKIESLASDHLPVLVTLEAASE